MNGKYWLQPRSAQTEFAAGIKRTQSKKELCWLLGFPSCQLEKEKTMADSL